MDQLNSVVQSELCKKENINGMKFISEFDIVDPCHLSDGISYYPMVSIMNVLRQLSGRVMSYT
jgi:hypothetical protein